jgi:hypothetical protein
LRDFEEIQISRQSSRGDCITRRKTFETFVWISSKNSALEHRAAQGSTGWRKASQESTKINQKSIGKHMGAQDSTREYRTAQASATTHGKDTTPKKIRNKYSQKKNYAAGMPYSATLQVNSWTGSRNI